MMTDIDRLLAVRATKSYCISKQRYEIAAFLRDREKTLQEKCDPSYFNGQFSISDLSIDQVKWAYEVLFNSYYSDTSILEEIKTIINMLTIEDRDNKIDQII